MNENEVAEQQGKSKNLKNQVVKKNGLFTKE